MNSREGYQQGSEFDEFDEFGKYGKFDDISPKTEIQLNKLKRRVPTERRILTNLVNMTNMADVTIFRQRLKFS